MQHRRVGLAALGALALLLSQAAVAQKPANFAGEWNLTMEGRQGTVTQTLKLEQDGDKVKGTLSGPRGETPVEGTVKGNQISFTAKRQTPRGEMVIEYTGTLDGDTIKGTMGGGQFSREWTAKKKK
ncbi:MAG: hypothetical protein K6U02_04225 [Firmicutes bacterium]|nr:hypothetical protein [Bacillota bacterium]